MFSTIDVLSVMGYFQTLFKTIWKNNSLILSEFARDQVPVEPCPGSSFSATQRLWYGGTGAETFVCCQSYFRSLVLPSTPYSSSGMILPNLADGHIEYSCDLPNPQIRALFTAACEVGTISVFLDGPLDNNNKRAAAKMENSIYPEENLSGICGTPEQIQQVKALVDEVLYLQAESQYLETFGSQLYCTATMLQSAGTVSFLADDNYSEAVYDQH